VRTSSFDVGVRDAAGQLTALGRNLQYGGVAVVTLALIVNFTALYFYLNTAAETKAASAQAELRGIVARAKAEIDKATALAIAQRTVREINKELPAQADVAAAGNRDQYFRQRLTSGEQPHDDSAPPRFVDISPAPEPRPAMGTNEAPPQIERQRRNIGFGLDDPMAEEQRQRGDERPT